MNDKYNALAKAKHHAWREMYRPDLHKKAIFNGGKKSERVPMNVRLKTIEKKKWRASRRRVGVVVKNEK